MPQNNRKNKINDEVTREMSKILAGIKDPRVNSGLVTITGSDVSADLKYAKIYFSVFGENTEDVKKGLDSAKGYIRNQLAASVNLRNTPELTFINDDSLEKGARITKILNDIKNDKS